ncbi:MAG: 50S ribosomal protein L10, partial [Acidimicrobiales bacterium]
KVAVVTEVRDRLSSASASILTEYRGLTVSDLSRLRRALREVGGEYKIYKNTLVRFAARDLGLDELVSLLNGPTAITFVDGDAAGVAKALRDFGRTHPALVVKGGLLGQSLLTARDAAALAELPSRDQLLARLAGGLAAPMRQFAGLLSALPRNFAYGLAALIDQRGGAEPAAPPSPAADAAEPGAAESQGSTGAVAESPDSAQTETTDSPEPAADAGATTEE